MGRALGRVSAACLQTVVTWAPTMARHQSRGFDAVPECVCAHENPKLDRMARRSCSKVRRVLLVCSSRCFIFLVDKRAIVNV